MPENPLSHPEIFISYKTGADSEALVEELEKALAEREIIPIRDKRDIGFRDNISDFMKRLGRGNYVVIVMSDGYLKSRHCMFELCELAEHEDFHDRIFPIIMPDARIFTAEDILDYVLFWQEKENTLDKKIKSVESTANLHGIREQLDLYARIRAQMGIITDSLQKMNSLNIDEHRETRFKAMLNALDTKIGIDNAFTTKDQNLKELIDDQLHKHGDDYQYDLFLAFSSENSREASNVTTQLRAYGLHVFMSNESLKSSIGQSYFERIDNALSSSHHMVLLCTPHSMGSNWVQREYDTFFTQYHIPSNEERRLIVLRGEGFQSNLLPGLMRGLQIARNPKEIVEGLLEKEDLLAIEDKQKDAVQNRVAEEEKQKRKLAEEVKIAEEKKRRAEEDRKHKAQEEARAEKQRREKEEVDRKSKAKISEIVPESGEHNERGKRPGPEEPDNHPEPAKPRKKVVLGISIAGGALLLIFVIWAAATGLLSSPEDMLVGSWEKEYVQKDMTHLDEEEKEDAHRQMELMTQAKITITFYENGTITNRFDHPQMDFQEIKGKWSLSKDGRFLITESDGNDPHTEPIEITRNKFILTGKDPKGDWTYTYKKVE